MVKWEEERAEPNSVVVYLESNLITQCQDVDDSYIEKRIPYGHSQFIFANEELPKWLNDNTQETTKKKINNLLFGTLNTHAQPHITYKWMNLLFVRSLTTHTRLSMSVVRVCFAFIHYYYDSLSHSLIDADTAHTDWHRQEHSLLETHGMPSTLCA